MYMYMYMYMYIYTGILRAVHVQLSILVYMYSTCIIAVDSQTVS